jgi:tRNA (mo5U34)-methyltransferase
MEKGHGDLERWQSALDALPKIQPSEVDLLNGLTLDTDCDDATRAQMRSALMGLCRGARAVRPVRRARRHRMALGLEVVAGRPHLDLKGKRILDVGCGNGYYMWRMLGAGADSVIGVDPNWLFFCQFQAVQRYLSEPRAWHLPFPFEDLPPNLEGFDTVFSMGVFYHRRSPIEHLLALKDCLVKGGELVLETLVVEGDQQQVLVPEDRYAQMRNVWFLPSVPALDAVAAPCRVQRRALRGRERDHGGRTARHRVDEVPVAERLPRPRRSQQDHRRLPAPMRAVIIARK